MLFTSRALLNQHIGKNLFFKKPSKLPQTLNYVSGVKELDSNISIDETLSFGMLAHPKGIAFTSKKRELFFGIRFDEIKHYKIHVNIDRDYELEIIPNLSKKITLTFTKADRKYVIPFFRGLKIDFLREERAEGEIKDSIGALIEEFRSEPGDCSLNVRLQDASLFGNIKKLEINKKEIYWGKEVFDVSNVRGFCGGIIINEMYGMETSRDYEITFNVRKGNPFRIKFTQLADKTEHRDTASFFKYLIDILFNVVAKNEVILWLEKLRSTEPVEYDEYTILREGLEFKLGRRKKVLVYWDELFFDDPGMIRWRYTNELFVPLQTMYDRRAVMFVGLVNWLNEDDGRLEALTGSSPI